MRRDSPTDVSRTRLRTAGFCLNRRGRCDGYIQFAIRHLIIVFVVCPEKEIICAAFAAKSAAAKKVGAVFADQLEADRAFPDGFYFVRRSADDTFHFWNGHLLIIDRDFVDKQGGAH